MGHASEQPRFLWFVRGFGLLLLLAVVGLFYVKWAPYYHKVFDAASSHTLGPSILSGRAASPPAPSFSSALDYAVSYFESIWKALVLALILAATVETTVPRDWLARVLGRESLRSSVLGGVLALPGMMCTCCTAPLVKGLRRSGVSVGGAVSYWLGNPTLNPAVLVFIVFTLGWRWAVLRLLLGIPLVFGAGLLAARLSPKAEVDPRRVQEIATPSATPGSLPVRWVRSLVRLAAGIIPEYVVIVMLLGAARAFLFPAAGPELGNSILIVVGIAIAGTLFVIPTAGEIPIIQTMLSYGIGAGPAGALLMTLAPVSLPSIAMVWTSFPKKRVLALTAGLTALAGVVGGLLGMAFL